RNKKPELRIRPCSQHCARTEAVDLCDHNTEHVVRIRNPSRRPRKPAPDAASDEVAMADHELGDLFTRIRPGVWHWHTGPRQAAHERRRRGHGRVEHPLPFFQVSCHNTAGLRIHDIGGTTRTRATITRWSP